MPHYFSMWDHRYFIVDFSHESTIGNSHILIVRSEIGRLISNQLKLIANYLQSTEYLFKYHKIKDKINNLSNEWNNTW